MDKETAIKINEIRTIGSSFGDQYCLEYTHKNNLLKHYFIYFKNINDNVIDLYECSSSGKFYGFNYDFIKNIRKSTKLDLIELDDDNLEGLLDKEIIVFDSNGNKSNLHEVFEERADD